MSDEGDRLVLAKALGQASAVDALDRRFITIGRAVIEAQAAGKFGKQDLANSFLREYREWKQAQSELPFDDEAWRIWKGRATGWVNFLSRQKVAVNKTSATQMAKAASTSSVHGAYSLVGCGQRPAGYDKDLGREKQHLGGYANGGKFFD